MPKTTILSNDTLQAALEGLQAQRERIAAQISEVQSLLNSHSGSSRPNKAEFGRSEAAVVGRKQRVITAEARERIAAAQKKRWAAVRKAKKLSK